MTVHQLATTKAAADAIASLSGGATLAAFQSRLAQRAEPPPARREHLASLADRELATHRDTLVAQIGRLQEVVAEVEQKPESGLEFLATLDLKLVSRDHDWRSLMHAAATMPPGAEPFQGVVLKGYLDYLRARRALVDELVRSRPSMEETEQLSAAVVSRALHSGVDTGALLRLPPRRPVVIPLRHGGEVPLYLGGHRFAVCDGAPPRLLSPTGESRELERHGLLIGRHADCDVVIDASLQRISRSHAVIEWPGYSRVIVIDLSSHGTWVEHADAARAK